jgi:hypothetical protein
MHIRIPTAVGAGLAAILLVSAPAASFGMDTGDVLKLLKAGVGERVILDQIQVEGARFRLSTDDILSLRQAGASDSLMQMLIYSGSESSSAATTDVHASVSLAYGYPAYSGCAWPGAYIYYAPFRGWNAWSYYPRPVRRGWFPPPWHGGRQGPHQPVPPDHGRGHWGGRPGGGDHHDGHGPNGRPGSGVPSPARPARPGSPSRR